MLRQLGKSMLLTSLLSFAFLNAIPVQAENSGKDAKAVQLSEQQKKEMAGLYKEMIEKRKEIISKYVEYGVMTEEKGKKIMERLDKHYNKIENNGFAPYCDKCKGKHSH